MRNPRLLLGLALALLLAASPLAAATVIERGIDIFTTTESGTTFTDFAANPIPTGFFCKGSPAFTGRVTLRGLPLETKIPGQLRGADTVIERLDDAAFDRNGVAFTRILFRALSLVSIEPIPTPCGAFHLYVTLSDRQRETTMHIVRDHENGGTFTAPLAVDVRLSFVPVSGPSGRRLELTSSFTFPPTPIVWSFEGGPGAKRVAPVVVDTDGDLVADTALPGTSNFAVGWSPDGASEESACTLCEPPGCHTTSDGKEHCTGGVTACYPSHCP